MTPKALYLPGPIDANTLKRVEDRECHEQRAILDQLVETAQREGFEGGRMDKLTTAKEMLEALDEFFVTASRAETGALWNILSALRGPDIDIAKTFGLGGVKLRTTTHIRVRAFPRLAKLNDSSGIRTVSATFAIRSGTIDYEAAERGCGWHFSDHVRSADKALRHISSIDQDTLKE